MGLILSKKKLILTGNDYRVDLVRRLLIYADTKARVMGRDFSRRKAM